MHSNLIKKPWVFIRALNMDPTMLGLYGQGFLNQVPTLEVYSIDHEHTNNRYAFPVPLLSSDALSFVYKDSHNMTPTSTNDVHENLSLCRTDLFQNHS